MWTDEKRGERMLSKEEREQIREETNKYEHKRAACIEALKIVQRNRGWISDEAIREIAPELGMSPEELDSVATFYNLIFRERVGKHVIFLCDSISCWIMGMRRVEKKLREQLGIEVGHTTSDGEFTILPIQCMGTCDHAPALMVDEELYRNVSPENVAEVVKKYKE
jgi:NADH-quinone oxidoreductase subunit E